VIGIASLAIEDWFLPFSDEPFRVVRPYVICVASPFIHTIENVVEWRHPAAEKCPLVAENYSLCLPICGPMIQTIVILVPSLHRIAGGVRIGMP